MYHCNYSIFNVNNGLKCYYKKSARLFTSFLKNNAVFTEYFKNSSNDKSIISADDFYKNVRCALIHEAQTKNYWSVKIYTNNEIDKKNLKMFKVKLDGEKQIFRTAIFNNLNNYFKSYTDELLTQENQSGRILRKFLARKIDYISEINPDNKWWWK